MAARGTRGTSSTGDAPDVSDRAQDPAWLRRVLDASAHLTFVLDHEARVVWSSAVVERMFGYDRHEVVGKSILDFVDPSSDPIALESVAASLAAEGLRLPMVFRARRADGTVATYEVAANNQLADPEVEGLVVNVRPAEERVLLERALEAIAAGRPLDEALGLLVEVCAAETLEAHGAILHGPDADGFARAVLAPDLPEAVAALLAGPAHLDLPWARATTTGEPTFVAPADMPVRLEKAVLDAGLELCWTWPIADPLGSTIGCVVALRGLTGPGATREPDHTRARTLGIVARLAGLALEQASSLARLEHQATHDPLTGLSNRTAFYTALERATLRDGTDGQVGVLFVDLDGFKPVNDRYGHIAGDDVLAVVGRRLAGSVREGDVVARLGGDEFAVLCAGVDDPTEMEALAARVVAGLSAPYQVRDEEVRLGASVGVSVGARGTCTGDGLVEAADLALYEVKAGGSGGWLVATPSGQPAEP